MAQEMECRKYFLTEIWWKSCITTYCSSKFENRRKAFTQANLPISDLKFLTKYNKILDIDI